MGNELQVAYYRRRAYPLPSVTNPNHMPPYETLHCEISWLEPCFLFRDRAALRNVFANSMQSACLAGGRIAL